MRNRFIFLTTILTLFFSNINFAQSISSGPVVGAVTNNSAKIYVKASTAASLDFIYDLDNSFANSSTVSFTTNAGINNNHAILALTGLNSNTLYFYQFKNANGSILKEGSFKTAPGNNESDNYTFAFGACDKYILTAGEWVDSIYNEIQNHNPDLFINLGDWHYPDVTDNLPYDNNFFSANPVSIEDSYALRYGSPFFKDLAATTPIVYVYDDHDYVNNNASKTTVSWLETIAGSLNISEIAIPANARGNIIKAYSEFFPSYELQDTSNGIYQKFTYGNVEFFMLDTRSNRSSVTTPLQNIAGQWVFNPDTNHTILGETQKQWLLDGLENSTATWKIIGSGVVFNKSYSLFLDSLIGLANVNPILENYAIELAAAAIDSWVGYPKDQNDLLAFIEDKELNNVVLISGDAHSGAMDNGSNSGIPELLAASLSQDVQSLAGIMAAAGFNIWSEGGQGVGNSNANNCFGKISTFGDDSLLLELIDEFGTIITNHTIYNCDIATIPTFNDLGVCNQDDLSNLPIDFNLELTNNPTEIMVNGNMVNQNNLNDNLEYGLNTFHITDVNGCKHESQINIDYLGIDSVNATLFLDNGLMENGNWLQVFEVYGGTEPFTFPQLSNDNFYGNNLVVEITDLNTLLQLTDTCYNNSNCVVQIVDANACTFDFTYNTIATVNLEENINPIIKTQLIDNQIIISSDLLLENVEIYNLNGMLIKKFLNKSNQFAFTLDNGIYYLSGKTDDKIVYKKLIVNN